MKNCPSIFELWQFAQGEGPGEHRPDISAHLMACPLCVETVNAWRQAAEGGAQARGFQGLFGGAFRYPEAPFPVQVGQIWTALDVTGLVLIVDEHDDGWFCAPLSERVAYLSNRDWRIEATETALGMRAMAMLGLEMHLDRDALGEHVAELPSPQFTELREADAALRRGERPHNVRLGPGLRGPSDVRFAFREEQTEYWRPAAQAALVRALPPQAAAADQVVFFTYSNPVRVALRLEHSHLRARLASGPDWAAVFAVNGERLSVPICISTGWADLSTTLTAMPESLGVKPSPSALAEEMLLPSGPGR